MKDELNERSPKPTTRRLLLTSAIAVGLLWCAQPPLALWPLALFALIPWLDLADRIPRFRFRSLAILWAVSTAYWLLSLQGLRYAHPLMFLPWIALACYLAVYHVVFLLLLRSLRRHCVPLLVAAPCAWVTQEILRNYLLTGISALMLGHTLADVPIAIQIADLFGTYGISFVVVMVNTTIYQLAQLMKDRQPARQVVAGGFVTVLMVVLTLVYGRFRMGQPTEASETTFALIQRSEPVEYEQSDERAVEIFRNYVNETVRAARQTHRPIDVVVWPESMFTAGMPWMLATGNLSVPAETQMSDGQFLQSIDNWQQRYLDRAVYLQQQVANAQAATAQQPATTTPHLIVGCGVVEYDSNPRSYSGVVSINPSGQLDRWYGKTHLVMFGEYIPLIGSIPGLKSLVPPGMGLAVGTGAVALQAGESTVAPVICIETAVERVVINQLAALQRQEQAVDAVVTVTNDGWFDDSAVIDHHLRCAQLVAVGARRPILSSANNGPTAWIDSDGQIVERLPTGTDGAIIATPERDRRSSLYTRIGDWPTRIIALLTLIAALFPRRRLPTEIRPT